MIIRSIGVSSTSAAAVAAASVAGEGAAFCRLNRRPFHACSTFVVQHSLQILEPTRPEASAIGKAPQDRCNVIMSCIVHKRGCVLYC